MTDIHIAFVSNKDYDKIMGTWERLQLGKKGLLEANNTVVSRACINKPRWAVIIGELDKFFSKIVYRHSDCCIACLSRDFKPV